ncbi:hypothetical protein T440DRAFT_515360 [Plenodomus tracheiphilus IPT5]|uniref:N-acetyltransferase domain-containing protein n=1 Tax=Plenodomus tracheiphilus IPT5 TaxID=1408161 RepID=A0A6A7BEF6_9PLEO|nr:hypothetical protein T440DRAFT_515360 [Plenodomus tracheiphilus IPT5]
MPTQNPLQISLLAPHEAETYTQIRHRVFTPTINQLLYPLAPASPSTLSAVTSTIRTAILSNSILYLKCTDTSTIPTTIIAGARWRHIAPKDPTAHQRTWAEVDAELTVPEPYAESDPALLTHFYEMSNANKREIMGQREYWVLDTLVTLPEHERRGAGGMLVAWGCERADERGVECYVEASVVGKPLYARFGFEVVREMKVEMGRFGRGEDLVLVIMVRPAKGSRTVGSDV